MLVIEHPALIFGKELWMEAADDWAAALASWAIPDEILRAAPESPWGFDVTLFQRIADEVQHAETPSRTAALDLLPPGGTVLDVGCGAGAASLALAPTVGTAVGVDESEAMLAAFAERAARLGIAHDEIRGRWPDVAAKPPVCDVVVCHHVVYNVADIVPFLRGLADRAARRVVIEMTAEHPLTWMNPLWERLHGITRPTEPSAQTLLRVLADMGIAAVSEAWSGPRGPARDLDVPTIRRRLCLPPERDNDVAAALDRLEPGRDRHFVSVWWDASR